MPAPRLAGLSRRAMLNLLGSSVGLGVVALWGEEGFPLAFQGAGRGAGAQAIPRGAIIRTLLKDMNPADLGPGSLLFHEHVGGNPTDPLLLDEVDAAKKAGVSCMVSARAGGRQNIDNLKALSMKTGMPIVACTGYYMQSAYPKEILAQSEDQIAEDLVQEARRDGLGAYGEIGSSANKAALTPDEIKVFHAVGKAHLRTNLPVFTHNPYGTGPNVPMDVGLRQLDAFESVGVKPERVAIGHVCCLDDPKAEIMKQIAKRGAYVGFDRLADHHPPDPKQPELVKDTSDELRIRMIKEFIDAGYANRLLLADDATTQARPVTGQIEQMMKDGWLTAAEGASVKATLNKAIAFGRTLTVFVPKMRAAGIKEDTIRTIIHDNPLRFMAFEPKMG